MVVVVATLLALPLLHMSAVAAAMLVQLSEWLPRRWQPGGGWSGSLPPSELLSGLQLRRWCLVLLPLVLVLLPLVLVLLLLPGSVGGGGLRPPNNLPAHVRGELGRLRFFPPAPL